MMLRKAFDGSGIPWASCRHEDRGDGALVVIPPGVSGLNLVGPLPERLRGLVRRHNHVSRDTAQIQLRAAAHFGLVEHDGHGFVGSDVNLLFRILDAPPIKQALAASRADLALIVSDHIYRSYICHHPSLLSPEIFKAVNFKVGQAEFKAWSFFRERPNCLQPVRTTGNLWEAAHERQRSIDSVFDSGSLLRRILAGGGRDGSRRGAEGGPAVLPVGRGARRGGAGGESSHPLRRRRHSLPAA
jgi:hypothetical protein